MILIVSHERDDHAAAVLGALRRTGHPVVMLDTARYPEHVTLRSEFTPDGTRWWVRGLDGVGSDAWVDLAGCHAAWWRRPQPYELNSAAARRRGELGLPGMPRGDGRSVRRDPGHVDQRP
ncbi:MAG: hypothetical protein V9E89_11760 [Ilumatobacteraceae bacterium]